MWRLLFLMWCALPLAAAEFAYPKLGHTFRFPRDHGSHPDFKIEWWYITGHLWDAEQKQRFGFQATFFRAAGEEPGAAEQQPEGAFAAAPLYLAHMALLEAGTGKFIFQERLQRSGWDAAASTETLDVRNGNWSLRFADAATGVMDLAGSIRSEAALTLRLTPAKLLVRFGEGGYSRKGAAEHAASYYLTWTRLKTSGTLRLNGRELTVHGEAWMDHEISSSQLAPEQAGWDWAALQLFDGREIMAYRMRHKDGSTDPFSTFAWVDAQGQTRHYTPKDFTWKPLTTWTSAATRAVYPQEVEVSAPDPATGQRTVFKLVPLAAGQELTGGIGGVAYWEGACRVLDAQGREVGSAFMELTGYAASLEGKL